METRRLQQFILLARHLSFSRAADVLNISQPTLSQNIRTLEHELGFRLFERTKRQVLLTPAGREYLSGIEDVLEDLDRCAQRGREAEAGLRGTLTITTVGIAMFTHLPVVVRQFRNQFTDLTVQISVLPNAEIMHLLRSKYADLVFTSQVERHPEIATRKLWPMPWRVVLPNDHPQAKERAVSLSDLSHDTLFVQPHSEGGIGGHEAVLALCREHQLTPRAIREVTGPSATQTLIGLVACGLGIAIVPSAYEQIEMPLVTFRPLKHDKNALQIYAAWRKSDENSIVRNFVEIAAKSVEGG